MRSLSRGAMALLLTLPSSASAESPTKESSPFAQRLAKWLRPSVREDKDSLARFRERLAELPPLSPGHSGRNIGLHSRFQPRRDTRLDITIDLGSYHPVERIVVFPVRGTFRGTRVGGYGFSPHFVLELAIDADFSELVHSVDSQSVPLPPRPDFPTQFVLEEPIEARFLRLRVLEHWTREDGRYLSAFGELMVLANNRNVALRAKVDAVSFTSFPDWHHAFIVDGQTDLGLPVSSEPSQTNGFLTQGSRDQLAKRWIQLELPRVVEVDDVTLIPAQPVDAPDQFGHGFPRRFRLMLSEDADFANAQTLYESEEWVFPNPGDNPAVFAGERHPTRFVRLEVSELSRINLERSSISLAEMQVFEDGENVALGAKVTASDVFDVERFLDVWRPEYLVDGYSSQNRLIRLEDWLDGLDERREVETQIAGLENQIETRTQHTLSWVLGGASLFALSSMGVIGLLIVRRKQSLEQQQEELRARIARDLHDDLGSRLGGMRLLSEGLLGAEELPEELRGDLDLLRQSSGEATDAMRDIVWLLDTRERSLEKLRQQMKRLIPSIVGSMPWEFHIDGAPDAEVDFEFRRQVVLAFREALNNAVRHSGSDRVECRIGGDTENFSFEVEDWGRGFDEASVKRGLGLNNLHKRADTLKGKTHIESTPGTGTVVRFKAPYRRIKQHRLA
ncbi:MAG: ATP-binding protein [Verrucomicrobiota bacterium]